MKPSSKAFINTIFSNKINVIFIILLNAIQAICENFLIVFTFYLLTFIQNSDINKFEFSLPIGEKILLFIGESNLINNINLILQFMIAIALIQGLCQYFGQINTEILGSWIREKINNDISKVVLDDDYERISKIKSGKLLTTSVECPDALRFQIKTLADLFITIFYLIVYSRILIELSFRGFVLSSIALLLVGSFQLFTQNKVKNLASKTNNFKSFVSDSLSELILGIKYIKASGSKEFVKSKFSKKTNLLKKQILRERIFYEITPPLSKFIGICIISYIFLIFTKDSLNNNLLLPTIGVFIVTLQRLIGKISELAQLNNSFNQNKGRMKLYDELMCNYNFISYKKNHKNYNVNNSVDNTITELSSEGIYYKFRNNNSWDLADINFNFKKGDLIGIVGRSGAGKTTFLNLICGLIKPSKGKFKINDIEFNQLNGNINKNISIVCQENYIISGTIFENIVWDQKPNRKKVLKIIQKIDNINFINNLREGIDTQIGKGGISISGGQSQLISLSRALYKDADILILDEATNALDNISERKIFQTIKDISKNKITFLVSHNLENIKICSEIFLLDKKNLKKQSSFEEMIENNKDILQW